MEKAQVGRVSGLEGVVVAETVLSAVDGEKGELILRGHDVEDVAGKITFEDAWVLLQSASQSAADMRVRFARGREAAYAIVARLGDALDRPDGMDALRASLAHLDAGTDAHAAEAVIAAVPVFAAAWWRRRLGLPIVAPNPALTHATDYLRMVRGVDPSPAAVAALEAYLVTVSDHGMNASTFTARVVASTGSDLVSAIVAAVGALKGPLHGGAPGPVLDMLDAIGSAPGGADAAASWIEAELAAGRRIMGMGHRIYRVRDPRAAVLEKAVERFTRDGGSSPRLPLARAVEAAAAGVLKRKYPTRGLNANVEFYTAVLLDAVGLPREIFSPTFAVGRVLGWCAHVGEQQRTGRLIRPDSLYVGPQVPKRL